jgi:hypothetical protein
MKELNPQNAFGELLLDLIEAQYGDIDSGVEALIQSTGLGEEEVIGIIQGDVIVEDENLLSSIVDAFPDADDNDLEVIVNVAQGVDEEDRASLIDEIEADETEEGMQELPEEESAKYGYYGNTANFSGDMSYELNQKVNYLENKLANFEAANAVSSRLEKLDNLASTYVDNQKLPPSYKTMLLGQFSNPEQRLARFSQIANDNGVDVGTMLFATEYALGLLTEASRFVEFSDYSLTDEDVAVANFSASLDNIVAADIEAIFNS